MRKKDLRSKAYAVPVVVIASLGVAGVGLMPMGAVNATDITSVTDTLSLTVEETCTFKNTSNTTFTGSALNGSEVDNFNDSGVHTFYLFCNNSNGFTISATPYDLTTTGGIQAVIAYTNQYSPSGRDGMWTAEITTDTPGLTATSPVPIGGGVVISSDTSSSANASFTATYSAYVGSVTPAGTYTGRIEYVLSSLSGTTNNNSGDSGGTGQNSGNGEEPGNEVTDNTGNGNSGSNSGNENPDNANSGNSGGSGDTQNASPKTLNNTYNTYNTYNTTNSYTTNNLGGGSSTPAATSTSGNSNGTLSSTSNKGTSGDNYEKPLGVTTTTTTSGGSSGIDPMPIVATGAVLAAVGIAAIAVARSDKDKEEQQK